MRVVVIGNQFTLFLPLLNVIDRRMTKKELMYRPNLKKTRKNGIARKRLKKL